MDLTTERRVESGWTTLVTATSFSSVEPTLRASFSVTLRLPDQCSNIFQFTIGEAAVVCRGDEVGVTLLNCRLLLVDDSFDAPMADDSLFH